MIVRIFLSLLFITIYTPPLLPLQRYKPVNTQIENYVLNQIEMRKMRLIQQMRTMNPAKVKVLAFEEETDSYTPLGRLLFKANLICILPVGLLVPIIYYFVLS